MNKLFQVACAAVAVLLLAGCSSTKSSRKTQQEPDAHVVRALQAIQAKYAPDRRLAIFSISAAREGDYLILKGEVENPDAKKELVETLSHMGIKVADRITVLPSATLGDRTWGIITLSVVNVREERGQPAELGTQVMMGHVVRLWKTEQGWYYVQSSDRYLGWTEDDGVVPCTKETVNAWNASKRLIVTAFADRIWEKPSTKSVPVSDVVTGALVRNTGVEGDWFKVELPDGRTGYLARDSATDYEEWSKSRQPSPANIEQTAKSLMGLPYLWGGTSVKGVDCSGFTKVVYFLNGVHLNRNASHQARQGTEVVVDPEFKNLKKGDLLFFGSKAASGKPERVVHVGIYLGDKLFIHSSGRVKINSLDSRSPIADERRIRTLLYARRVLPGA